MNADSDDDEPIVKRNPVDRLNRTHQWAETKPKTRHIPDELIPAWVEAVRSGLVGLKHAAAHRDALLFILLTGARLAEAMGDPKDGYPPLRWRDVDLKARTITLTDTKNRRDHVLPIGTALTAMLGARKAVARHDAVFSNPDGTIAADMRAAFARIEKATGVDVSAHDLRRTLPSLSQASCVGVKARRRRAQVMRTYSRQWKFINGK